MIPIPEFPINHLLEIHRYSVQWFLKKYIDPEKCLPEQIENFHQKIIACKSKDDQKIFLLTNFSLYARTIFKIENEIKNFCFGLAAIKDNESGKWGYVDIYFNLIIPAMYDEAENFNVFGHAPVKKENYWGMINKLNNTIVPFVHDNENEMLLFPYDE